MTQNSLPPGWCVARLGDLVGSPQYGFTASATSDVGGPRFLRITDIKDGAVDWSSVPFCTASPSDFERFRLRDGDLVFARSGSVEKAWRVRSAPDAVFASYLLRGSPATDEVGAWLETYVKSPSYLAQVRRAAAGTGMSNVNAQKLAQFEVPIAPSGSMRRLVEVTEHMLARSKKAKASLDRIPGLLEKLKRSILAAAFRGDLTKDWREAHPDVEPAEALLRRIRAERRRRWEEAELARLTARGKAPTDDLWRSRYQEPVAPDLTDVPELPSGWRYASVDELTTRITSGSRAWSQYYDRGVGTFIMAGNVRPGRLDLTERQAVDPPPGDADCERSQVVIDDILITIVGANTGDVCRVPSELPEHYVCQSVALLRPVQAPTSTWLEKYLTSHSDGHRHLRRYAYGQGRPHLSFDQLRALPVAMPPALEAAQISEAIQERLAAHDRVLAMLANQTQRIASLDAAILSKAFRGELVPQDPTDEPASVLLDRIRAAREAASAEPDEAKPKRPRARRAAARDDTSAPAVSGSTMPAEAAASSTKATSTPAAGAPHPFQPTLFPTTATPFLDLPRPAQLPLVHDALRGLGALTTDDAIRRVADHLRTHGHAEFMRLRSDGPLYAALDKALDAAVREGLVDRPRRGHVRAIVPDAKHYTDADWARCLEAARAEHAATTTAPLDQDALIRAAADWAVENMGLAHQRLRTGGSVHQGLTRALAASKPSG